MKDNKPNQNQDLYDLELTNHLLLLDNEQLGKYLKYLIMLGLHLDKNKVRDLYETLRDTDNLVKKQNISIYDLIDDLYEQDETIRQEQLEIYLNN